MLQHDTGKEEAQTKRREKSRVPHHSTKLANSPLHSKQSQLSKSQIHPAQLPLLFLHLNHSLLNGPPHFNHLPSKISAALLVLLCQSLRELLKYST